MTPTVLTIIALMAAAIGGPTEHQLTKPQERELAQYFGFGPMQIYKLEPGIQLLELADLDTDGRTDLVLWNGHRSRFELFYQTDPDAPPATEPDELERNEIPNRGNLRNEHVPVAYRVAALKIADLTGDQRPDIVFFGEPKEVVILPGQPQGGFGAPEALRAPDGEPRGSFLNVGDYNHDGRCDVALLGEEVLQVFHQKPGGGLAKPVRLVHGIKQPLLMLTADINGDGRDDLAISTNEDQYGVYACLQDSAGALSALRRIKIPKLRSMTFTPSEGGDDLFSIEATTGRLQQYRWQVPPKVGGGTDWPQRLLSYPVKMEGRRLPFAVGDLTGDGLADCVTADPDAARLILFAGTADGLGAGKVFPGLMKTTDLQIADLDGDGRNELLSVSVAEKTLGRSQFTAGRLTFPTPMPVTGAPLAVTAGPLQSGDKSTCLAYVSRASSKPAEKEADDEEYEDDEANGRARINLLDPASGNELSSWPCDELKDDPTGLRFADVNQDGRNDLLVFSRYAPLQTYLQNDTGSFAILQGDDTRSGLVRDARLESACLADVTGDGRPELLLAQGTLARALLVKDRRWIVVDQYNPETGSAELTGLATLPATNGNPTLVMYDRQARDLLVLKPQEDQTYAVSQTMPVGNFELCALTALTIGQPGQPAVLLADNNKLALLTPGERAPTLVEQRSYESEVKEAWLGDAVPGDLNHDGVRDVALVDMRKGSIEVVTTGPDGALVRACRFRVFQGKRFSEDPSQMGEPRELLVGDVTGDGINDVALLVHDRLIIYPGQ